MKAITDKEGKIVTGYEADISPEFENYECIIPEGVTKIGYSVFYLSKLKKVIFPKSLTEIDNNAFESCHQLQEVVLPNNIVSLGRGCFTYCINLKSINLPENLEYIADNAFAGCWNLTKITVSSYKVYSLLNGWVKFIATVSIVKNYYNKTVKYTEEEIQDLKEYIKEKRIELFPYAMNNSDLSNFIVGEMDKIYNIEYIKNLFDKIQNGKEEDKEFVKVRTAGNFFLLNYMNKNGLIGKLPSSQELTLDDEEDTESKGNGLGK